MRAAVAPFFYTRDCNANSDTHTPVEYLPHTALPFSALIMHVFSLWLYNIVCGIILLVYPVPLLLLFLFYLLLQLCLASVNWLTWTLNTAKSAKREQEEAEAEKEQAKRRQTQLLLAQDAANWINMAKTNKTDSEQYKQTVWSN